MTKQGPSSQYAAMERTSVSFDFENQWRQIRAEGKLIPPRSAVTPKLFRKFLPQMALAVVEPENDSIMVRLAGTEVREFAGFELTGMNFASFNPDIHTEFADTRRRGYHDHPYGRCEILNISFEGYLSARCEITLLPLWGNEGERSLAVLMSGMEKFAGMSVKRTDELTNRLDEEIFIDIGAGLPDY